MILKLFRILLFSALFISLQASAQSWPWASYATGVGGADLHGDHYVAVDNYGNAYGTNGFQGNIIFGQDTLSNNVPYSDIYLVKYNVNGNVKWATQSHAIGLSAAVSRSVATEGMGNVYITGFIYDSVIIGHDTLYANNREMCLLKYDTNGNEVWVRRAFGTNFNDVRHVSLHSASFGNSIATDKWGNVYVTGGFTDTVIFGSDTLRQYGSTCKMYLAKYNASGKVLWVRHADDLLPSTSSSDGNKGISVAVDESGDPLVLSTFTGSMVVNADTISAGGNVVLLKYDSSGAFQWFRQAYMPQSFLDVEAGSIAADGAGGIYEIGAFYDTLVFGSNKLISPNQQASIFLVKYNALGNVMWAKQSENVTGSAGWIGFSVACDTLKRGGGYLVGTGGTTSSNNHQTFTFKMGAVYGTLTINRNTEIGADVVLQFDSAGNGLCASLFSEIEDDGSSIGVSPSSRYVYVAGDAEDSAFFGNNIVSFPIFTEEPFISQWQSCCSRTGEGNTKECNAGDNITLNASFANSYYWSNNATTSSITIAPMHNTSYEVITNTGTCVVDSVIAINVINFKITACCNDSIVSGNSIGLEASPLEEANYTWLPNSNLTCSECPNPIASPTINTIYTVIVTDTNGCRATDSVLIRVNEKCGSIFIPTAFSPNKDGQNDLLYVKGNCINTIDFKIYDRWGNKVFEAENVNEGWDGTFKGQPMNTGTYVYQLQALMKDNTVVSKKGNITLIR